MAMSYVAMVLLMNTLTCRAVVVQAFPLSCVHCVGWMILTIAVDVHLSILDLHLLYHIKVPEA